MYTHRRTKTVEPWDLRAPSGQDPPRNQLRRPVGLLLPALPALPAPLALPARRPALTAGGGSRTSTRLHSLPIRTLQTERPSVGLLPRFPGSLAPDSRSR